jgi:hypothetical protein
MKGPADTALRSWRLWHLYQQLPSVCNTASFKAGQVRSGAGAYFSCGLPGGVDFNWLTTHDSAGRTQLAGQELVHNEYPLLLLPPGAH